MSLDDEIDGLFALPPDGFTAARDELAKRLSKGGDNKAAAEVKRLRKPTLIAWALNQLASRNRREIEELIEAGNALRSVQRKALSGVKGGEFREATQARRKLVQKLTGRALEILREAGRGPQGADEEIGRWLEGASSGDDATELLLGGRVTKPIGASIGFDSVVGFELVQGKTEVVDADRKAKETARKNAERQAEKAEADARRARMRADTLARDLDELSRRSKDAEHEAEALERAAADARERLEDTRRGTS